MKLVALLLAFGLFDGATDPWTAQEIVQPKLLAERLQAKEAVACVLRRLPNALQEWVARDRSGAGWPCSKADGLETLKKSVAGLPRDKELFIYCGCCPFVKCPNIRPAYSALHDLGFTKIRVVMIETNLHTDWIEKGYPSEKPAAVTQ